MHNLSRAIPQPITEYICKNWVQSDQTNWLKGHILARIAHLALTAISLIVSSVDTFIGACVGIGVILTGGADLKLYEAANIYLDSSALILADPFMLFCRGFLANRSWTICNWLDPAIRMALFCRQAA